MNTRRSFLQTSLAGALGALLEMPSAGAAQSARDLHIAPFRFDVTVPLGHSLCGGWITPATTVEDPLEAIGIILLGAGKPIVLCAVDWTGILNEAHLKWREALAEGAGTTPDRVSVHTVHQHNAPFACLESQRYVEKLGIPPTIMDVEFFMRTLDQARTTVAEAVKKARPVTAIATAEVPVSRIACNRRIIGEDGKMRLTRGVGAFKSHPELLDLPEGIIDPMLKTVAFYDGETKVAACHYYAVHPISRVHDGVVSADFPGVARRLAEKAEPGCTHIYFTACAGNINAGKYTDLTAANMRELGGRLYSAMTKAISALEPAPVDSLTWTAAQIQPERRASPTIEEIEAAIHKKGARTADRNRNAFRLTWQLRCKKGDSPLTFGALHLNGDVALLHLPAEVFVEYQLAAQRAAPTKFVAIAAYGDDGPWYIPTAAAYPQGGYEVSVAFCEPGIDRLLSDANRSLI
ncbi:MAG: hypothetical protein ACC661_02420 [Verrucomicrobiales bacterium]